MPFDEVFVSKFMTPMTARAIQYIVAGYMKEADIKGASVHTFRHRMATHHVARNIPQNNPGDAGIREFSDHDHLRPTESPKEGSTRARIVI
jgi:integrase